MSRSASARITESQSRLRSQHADTDSMTGVGRSHRQRKHPTIAELNEELSRAGKRLIEATDACWHDPEYKRLITAANARRDVAFQESEGRRQVIQSEIEDLKGQIQEAKARAAKTRNSTWVPPNEWPDKLRKFLSEISRGVDWGVVTWKGSKRNWQVRWMSRNQRFIILTRPGGPYWSARSQAYGKADHWLVDLNRMKTGSTGGIGGGMTFRKHCTIMSFEGGKLTRHRRQLMIDRSKIEESK